MYVDPAVDLARDDLLLHNLLLHDVLLQDLLLQYLLLNYVRLLLLLVVLQKDLEGGRQKKIYSGNIKYLFLHMNVQYSKGLYI